MRLNIEERLYNYCYSGKSVIVAYYECVYIALGIQDAMRILRIVICGLSGCTIFSTLSHKLCVFFQKIKIIEHKICVLNFSTILSESFLIPRRVGRDVITNLYWSSCKVIVLLVSL